jgi:exodeoxyribonuclease VII large subunit
VRALSPLETLRRGYAVLQDDQGHVVTGVETVSAGSHLTARVVDGWLAVTVDAARPDPAVERTTPTTDSETNEDADE